MNNNNNQSFIIIVGYKVFIDGRLFERVHIVDIFDTLKVRH